MSASLWSSSSNELFLFEHFIAKLWAMLNTILLNARARLRAVTNVAKLEAFTRISQETGLTVSWLQKFADGRIDNPTITSLDRLIAYLDKIDRPSPSRHVQPSMGQEAAA